MTTTSMAVTQAAVRMATVSRARRLSRKSGPQSRNRGRDDQRDDDGESQQLVHGPPVLSP